MSEPQTHTTFIEQVNNAPEQVNNSPEQGNNAPEQVNNAPEQVNNTPEQEQKRWDEDVVKSEEICPKENKTTIHEKRIPIEMLTPEHVHSYFQSSAVPNVSAVASVSAVPNVSAVASVSADLEKKVVDLINAIGHLTGLLFSAKCYDKGAVGTCFLQNIRKVSCDVTDQQHVLTFTTSYHVFCKREDSYYILAKEWKMLKPWIRLFYNKDVNLFNKSSCPVLKNIRLIESDKEIDIINDWCAIECDCEDPVLVDRLKGYLKDYHEKQKTIYEISKKAGFEKINLVAIVGHPHGRPKQVSLGHHFEEIKEIAREVRSGQRWCRNYYDAPTCKGSSGSPVFIFGQPITGFGYWFGHPHNHRQSVRGEEKEEKVKVIKQHNLLCLGRSTIGVEQICR